jgi:hypothetical protein
MGRSTRFRGAPFLLLKAQKPTTSAGDLTCGGDSGEMAWGKALFTADPLCFWPWRMQPFTEVIMAHKLWITVIGCVLVAIDAVVSACTSAPTTNRGDFQY